MKHKKISAFSSHIFKKLWFLSVFIFAHPAMAGEMHKSAKEVAQRIDG